ncbi:hypothetical protein CO670_16230 [Rhizobium sp. J15]|nr:hypothetical protein CO670_16230 [Rhizobium sp. J15]
MGIHGCNRDVCDAGLYALSSIAKHNIVSIGRICKFSFDDSAKASKLKQHIWTVFAVDMNSLRVRCNPELRDKQRELSIYGLFTIAMTTHSCSPKTLKLFSCDIIWLLKSEPSVGHDQMRRHNIQLG